MPFVEVMIRATFVEDFILVILLVSKRTNLYPITVNDKDYFLIANSNFETFFSHNMYACDIC